MRDSQHGGQDSRAGSAMAALARSVVQRLAAREEASGRPVDETVVASIARALLEVYPEGMDALRQDLRRARISDTDLVDRYFPEVARYLGCAWADDAAPFTDVSIAVARMQSILRDVGRSWTSNATGEPASATVLLILPEGEQHSFGAMLLAGQLRRQGISVRLEVGTASDELRRLVQGRGFDCAMISVACEESLGRCKAVVDALRHGSGGRLWIAVGGPLLQRPIDLRALTGADIATSDPLKALQGALSRQARIDETAG
jgi:MerR family transcriptional regulator, light-induced transcriptional regulator